MAERALNYTERRGGNTMAGNGNGVRAALSGSNTWHPTVVNLLVLVVVEVALYAAMRYAFRSFHGG